MTRAGTDPMSPQFDTDGEASDEPVARHSFVSGNTVSPLHQQLMHTVESSPESTAVHEEAPESALFLRGRSISDSVAEQDEEVPVFTVN